jgi:hypothetical protein
MMWTDAASWKCDSVVGFCKHNLRTQGKKETFCFVRFEVRMAVSMTSFFWVVTPCRRIGRYQHFRKTCCLYLLGWSSLQVEKACFSKLWHIAKSIHGITTQKNSIFSLRLAFVIFFYNIYWTEILFTVHKAHREELECVLQVLEKVLVYLPELLSRRWQCHSLTRIMTKLLHPGNSWKLRREAIRYSLFLSLSTHSVVVPR